MNLLFAMHKRCAHPHSIDGEVDEAVSGKLSDVARGREEDGEIAAGVSVLIRHRPRVSDSWLTLQRHGDARASL